MTFSPLTTQESGNGGQYSARGRAVDRIILHHCASTSLSGVLKLMASGSREVSANYVIGPVGEIVGVVPEEYRAWTSSSPTWDGRAITFEIVNESGAPDWRISDAAFHAVASVMADISARHDIPLNRDTVITHQELYQRYGASYATACPGPYLQSRVDDLIALASSEAPTPAPAPEPDVQIGDIMAFKSVGIAYRPEEGKDRLISVGLDFESGQKTEAIVSKEYGESWYGGLTQGGMKVLSKGHYDQVLKEFDAAVAEKREHELAIARASAGK